MSTRCVALRRVGELLVALLGPVVLACSAMAQERPYFVTYSHEMEEPGDLEIESVNALGRPGAGNFFWGSNMELEYGVTAWWTSELYLDGQSTQNENTIYTGFRLENRFRPLMREHRINPVVYFEYENISADKTLREVVGHDGAADMLVPNHETRPDVEREVELKLILGSNFRGWNLSENFIFEKNLAGDPWEFGYAVGAARPLALAARPHDCIFCPERFQAGVELYGGLGDTDSFGLHNTSHYIGPTINWSAPFGTTFSFSPQFGLNDYSIARVYRFGLSYEIDQFWSRMRGR